jgi:hypothetical protein
MDDGCFLLTSDDSVTPFLMRLNKLRYWERETKFAKA